MSDRPDLEALLADAIAHHEAHGTLPPNLPDSVSELAQRYLTLASALETGPIGGTFAALASGSTGHDPRATDHAEALPAIEGFRTIERIGSGGMGEVYKLRDLTLDRIVAAKIIRRDVDAGRSASAREFLREAQSLALFSDSRIVRVFECRTDRDPAVIIMEYVDGFELGQMGPSLEFRQRAKVMRDVCDAIHHAHQVGIQHRDLKPSNIMLDGALRPKILDFGLSGSDPARGHLRGTVQYIAPEQLDPSQAIDARTDVYALGVILYELLAGAAPYQSHRDTESVLDAVRAGQPRLPAEINPSVPEGLQAIALKAMERRPADRYQTALEMAQDLDRYLEGRPVAARPTQYATTLGTRVGPHVDQVNEWLRLRLIYPHEAERLRSAYKALEAREDDWIVASRVLSYSQITLYLGAFFLFAGSLFYFFAHRVYEAAHGVAGPMLVLGLPFLGLNIAGRWLYRREHQAVAVAFFLAGVSLLPLFLLIVLNEWHFLAAQPDSTTQLFDGGWVSNRQLQFTIAASALWSSWLAFRTRTGALSTVSTVLIFLLGFAVLADFGLRGFIENGEYDRIAVRLWVLVLVYALAGYLLERNGRHWFARPAYVAGAIVFVLAFDLLALNGRLFQHLGISLSLLQPPDVEDPTELPTLAALSLGGMLFYGMASAIERLGTPAMPSAARLLILIAPFSLLEPLAYLCETQLYDQRFDWMYLALAVLIAVASERRQRKSFYYAGLINSGFALYLIAARHEWFNQPSWAKSLVAVGLAALVAGFLFDRMRKSARR